jgi:hypothetical protein
MVSFTRRGEGDHIEAWRQHYNEVRPHSSLDYPTPNEFVAREQDQRPVRRRAGSLRFMGLRAPARCLTVVCSPRLERTPPQMSGINDAAPCAVAPPSEQMLPFTLGIEFFPPGVARHIVRAAGPTSLGRK